MRVLRKIGELAWKKQLIPAHIENNILNFYLSKKVKSTPREDLEMGNDEDEEPLEAQAPRARMTLKIPRVDREHEDSGMLFTELGVACVQGRGAGGHHRVELLEEEGRARTTQIVAFDYGLMTQENADTFPTLVCRDSRCGQTGVTCCGRGCPAAYSISFLVGVIMDILFSQKHPETRHQTEHENTSRCSDSSMCGSGSDSTRTT